MLNPVTVKIGGLELTLNPRAFESGKIGYGYYGKLPIGGQDVQVSLNLVIPKSEASQTDQAQQLRRELADKQAAKAAAK